MILPNILILSSLLSIKLEATKNTLKKDYSIFSAYSLDKNNSNVQKINPHIKNILNIILNPSNHFFYSILEVNYQKKIISNLISHLCMLKKDDNNLKLILYMPQEYHKCSAKFPYQ